jgi:hypothetical protein
MNDNYLDIPPPGEQRITELHLWVATHPDGGEGIVSADVPIPGIGSRHIPLMSSRRELAEKMKPFAEHAQQAAAKAGKPVSLRIVTYRRSE